MQRGNRIGLAAVLVCVFTPGLFANTITVFNLDSISENTGTPFSDTVAGLEASFSSDGDPGGFVVGSSFDLFANLTGNVLSNNGAVQPNLTLTIAFSAPQTSISTPFAVATTDESVPLNLTAFNGASEVGSTSATGTIPFGFEIPEGVISFSGPAFNSVVLSSPADAFFIDNVTVTAASTAPEPSSLSLVALAGFVGLCVSAITRLRRRGAR
jgi:hypothetical protein